MRSESLIADQVERFKALNEQAQASIESAKL